MDKMTVDHIKELKRVRQGLQKIRSSRAPMKIKPASDSLAPLGAFAEDDPEVHASFCLITSSLLLKINKH